MTQVGKLSPAHYYNRCMICIHSEHQVVTCNCIISNPSTLPTLVLVLNALCFAKLFLCNCAVKRLRLLVLMQLAPCFLMLEYKILQLRLLSVIFTIKCLLQVLQKQNPLDSHSSGMMKRDSNKY